MFPKPKQGISERLTGAGDAGGVEGARQAGMFFSGLYYRWVSQVPKTIDIKAIRNCDMICRNVARKIRKERMLKHGLRIPKN